MHYMQTDRAFISCPQNVQSAIRSISMVDMNCRYSNRLQHIDMHKIILSFGIALLMLLRLDLFLATATKYRLESFADSKSDAFAGSLSAAILVWLRRRHLFYHIAYSPFHSVHAPWFITQTAALH